MKLRTSFATIILLILFSYCSSARHTGHGVQQEIQGASLNPVPGKVFQTGRASWYGKKFHGRRTANGEIYDMYKLTAAHKELSFHTLVEVENLDNGRKVIVRINDRGPFVKGRIIDLSYKAAQRLGMVANGTARVRLRTVKAGVVTKQQPDSPVETGTSNEQEITTSTEQEIVSSTDQETGEEYYLQAGAFSGPRNAARIIKKLKKYIPSVRFDIEYGDGLYKVVSEKKYPRSQAEAYRNHLEERDIKIFIKRSGDIGD